MILKGVRGLGTLGRVAFGLGLIVVAISGAAYGGVTAPTPEIDAGSMGTALALLSGAILVVTNKVRRK